MRGTTANQRMEERKRERSQKKADSISRMTRTGSAAMVKMNLVRILILQSNKAYDMLGTCSKFSWFLRTLLTIVVNTNRERGMP